MPDNALVRTEKGAFVCTINDGAVHMCKIEVLGTGKGQAAVKGDIAAGMQVAVAQENKLLTLSEGMKVATTGGKE